MLTIVLGLTALATPVAGGGISEGDARFPTDANIITAIDDSSSIILLERTLEYSGLARAVIDPDFLARIATGPNRRVGFTAFTWSSDGKIDVIVPWMIIATPNDASVASAMLLKAADIDPAKRFAVRWTDVALAIRAAAAMKQASPFPSSHTFINICSNGISNSGAAPRAVRDRVLDKDVTISAVLLGNRPGLADYYARNVVGGGGAFILPISDTAAASKLLIKKFWMDLTS
jgi:hypothetical protein